MYRTMILILLFSLCSGYLHYKHYQEKRWLLKEQAALEQIIKSRDDEIRRYEQINQQVMAAKIKLENQSMALARRLKNALKDNPCNSEPVPASVANRLHRRAYQIRQSITNTSQFTQ